MPYLQNSTLLRGEGLSFLSRDNLLRRPLKGRQVNSHFFSAVFRLLVAVIVADVYITKDVGSIAKVGTLWQELRGTLAGFLEVRFKHIVCG